MGQKWFTVEIGPSINSLLKIGPLKNRPIIKFGPLLNQPVNKSDVHVIVHVGGHVIVHVGSHVFVHVSSNP
jgi:hypothetical protein